MYEEDTTPSDWFYGCLNTMNWDLNGNGVFGEIEDSVDLNSDIIVSRLPASNYQEAETMVNRIIEYESNPKTNNWEDNILMCGTESFFSSTYDGVYMSDVHHEGVRMYNECIAPYWEGEIKKLYDTGTDFEGDMDYEFSAEHLQNEISKGYTFINVDTHGGTLSLKMEEGVNYHRNHAESCNNSGYSVFVTQACLTNAFDSNCLSRGFMRNPYSGILAYLGASRDSRFPQSLSFMRSLYKNLLLGNTKQFGRAVYDTKQQIIGFCNRYNKSERWNLFSFNLLGDPETPLFLSSPKDFSNVTISYQNGIMTINTGQTDCKICVMSLDDMGSSYYEVRDSVSTTSFANIPDECSICITKVGYIPYLTSFCKIKYVQNETYEKDIIIRAGKTLIGSNVTTQKEEGPVIIQNGKSTINSSQEVIIKNDFEVKLGAIFEINVNK